VIAASISNLRFPPSVEGMLVQQWPSTWLQRAQLERNLVERRRSYAVHEGREQALIEFAKYAISLLATTLVDEAGNPLPATELLLPNLKSSTAKLLAGTHKMIVQDSNLHQILDYEEKEIADLIEWVRR
jgi:hypothetical protein